MNVKPLTKLSTALRTMLMLCIPVNIIACCADVFTYLEFRNFPLNEDPNEVVLTSQTVAEVVSIAQMLLFLVVGVTFLRWIYRCCKNLRAQTDVAMTFSPAWAVGWYFVPIANLFKPYQAMREIFYVSHRDRVTFDMILPLWWTLWLLASFLGSVAGQLTNYASTAVFYKVAAGFGVLANLSNVALDVTALMLIATVSQAYLDNYEKRKFRDEDEGRSGGVRILQHRR